MPFLWPEGLAFICLRSDIANVKQSYIGLRMVQILEIDAICQPQNTWTYNSANRLVWVKGLDNDPVCVKAWVHINICHITEYYILSVYKFFNTYFSLYINQISIIASSFCYNKSLLISIFCCFRVVYSLALYFVYNLIPIFKHMRNSLV